MDELKGENGEKEEILEKLRTEYYGENVSHECKNCTVTSFDRSILMIIIKCISINKKKLKN